MSNYYLLGILALLISFSACSTTKDATTSETSDVRVADIYINDDFRGATPGTIRVHRGRRELSVALKQGRQTVRTFTVEEYYSKNRTDALFNANQSQPDGSFKLSVDQLPSKDKKNFVIPFVEKRLTIEDKQFGLTIIIID